MGWDVSIPKDAVKVQVENGWVTLTGQVDWYYQKDAAGQELRHLSGVTGLSDRITVKPRVDVANISDSSQQHDAVIGGEASAVEVNDDFLAAHVWKQGKRCFATLDVSALQDGWLGCQFHGISSSMHF